MKYKKVHQDTQIVNGIKIFYKIYGETGHPLLLISGLSAPHSVWNSMAHKLSSKYKVLIFDNPGIGSSDIPKECSLDYMAQIIFKLSQNLFNEKINILGHSMGGKIAQILSLKHSFHINSMILMNTTTKINGLFKIVLEQKMSMYKENISLKIIDKLAIPWSFSEKFLSNKEKLKSIEMYQEHNPCPQTESEYLAQYNSIDGFDSSKWSKSIKVPTLIIGGDEDLIAPKIESIKLNENIKDSLLTIYKDVGHIPQVENPRQLLEDIINFLQKHNN